MSEWRHAPETAGTALAELDSEGAVSDDARYCPRGHLDVTARGYCASEVVGILGRLRTERDGRLDRGDTVGAKYTDRHIARTLQRLTSSERKGILINSSTEVSGHV